MFADDVCGALYEKIAIFGLGTILGTGTGCGLFTANFTSV